MFENPKLQFSQNSQPKNWILGHKTAAAQPLDLLSRYLLLSALRWNLCPGRHRLSPTATHQNPKKTKQHPNLSQTCSNAPEATQGKQASLWPPEAYFLEGFQIYNLEKHTSQLGFAHFIQPQTIPTKWYVKSTTSACELARVSNMARTRASLRWNVSPMAFSSCSTSWFSSCWFWIQKNQHFLP